MNNFKFYITSGPSPFEINPINSNAIIFEFKPRNVGDVVPQLVLNTSLILNKEDYNYVKGKESTDLCTEISLRIDLLCNGVYSPYWYGVFSPAESNWDYDRCTLDVSVRPKENIKGDLKINFLEIPNNAGVDDVYTGAFATERIYTNCRPFQTVLLYIAQQSNPQINSIVSNFFQINPIISTDEMIPGIFNFYKEMFIGSLGDIQEPIPSNLAQIEFISFNQLMNDLNVLFDVFWYIDSNYNLRVEHRLFFEGVQGMDLTTPFYQKYIKGKNQFSYLLDELVKYETWRIIDNKQYCRLVYEGCADLTKQQNERSYQTEIIRTDYYSIRYGDGSSNDTGIFLFATDQELGLFRMIESAEQNTMLLPSVLVNKFHRYGRPDNAILQEYYQTDDGNQIINFNQGEFLAYSVKPIKIQRDLTIPLCCDDDFDYKKQLLTNWGLGYHENAKINYNKNTLTLDLKYKVRNDSPDISPSDLPGLDLWLKSDQGVIYDPVTFKVSEWTDYSGNNRHAVNASPSTSPVFLPGVVPFTNSVATGSVDLDGGFLKTPAFQIFPSKRGSIFLLHGVITVSGTFHPIISTNNSAGPSVNEFDLSVADFTPSPDAFVSYNIGLSVFTQYYSPETKNGLFYTTLKSNTEIDSYQDGLRPASSPGSWPNTQPNSNPLTIGKNTNISSAASSSNLFEIIIFNRHISDLERQKVELYLAKKWGLNLYNGI